VRAVDGTRGLLEGAGVHVPRDDGGGHGGQRLSAAAGVGAHEGEGVLHARSGLGGENALGLLDEDPAVQGGLQLLGEQDLVANGALVQESDGGDVGQSLGDGEMLLAERPPSGAEQVQGTDHLPAQAQGHRMRGVESDVACGPGEHRPPVRGVGEVDVGDDLAGGEAVQAGTLALLELEIAENVLIHNVDKALSIVTELKKMGVRIAIDDFGTGYSTLAMLQRFPLDTIKIARSFIRGVASERTDESLTDAVIAMGRALSLTVVAQGVETKEQAEFLRKHTCDELQGFYFTKPLPAEDATELLIAQSPEITYLGLRMR